MQQSNSWIHELRAPATHTRGALQIAGRSEQLPALQAQLEAIDATHWRPLPCGRGWTSIQLIEPDGRGGARMHPLVSACPTMLALAEGFGAPVMALTLARLEPGGGVHEHRDISGGLSMGVVRLHVPLRTAPEVEFVVEGVRVSMGVGETWQLDTTYPHRVHNHSQIDRVHLIIDLEATPELRERLRTPDLRDHLHRAAFAAVCVGKGVELAFTRPQELLDRARRFARLRLLGQSVMTFDRPEDAPAEQVEQTEQVEPAALQSMPSEVPKYFACPECRGTTLSPAGDLAPRPGVPWAGTQGLRCSACAREYPYVNGVWVLWSDELAELIAAGEPELEASSSAAPDPRAVKQANFTVYQQMSDAYGEHADASVSYVEQLRVLGAHARALLGATEAGPVHVDVGCASGFALDVDAPSFSQRIGVDISLRNLEQVAARGHLAVLADAERLPFAADTIDLVTCFAAMHHFPHHEAFLRSAKTCLRDGGVLLTSADPSLANLHMGPLARAAWELRKPVYRTLSRVSDRFYLHADARTQALNDLAEHHRTGGGFVPEQLRASLSALGYRDIELFHGVDRHGARRYGKPPWQALVLHSLSGRNPLLRENFVSLTTLSRKRA